jgi:TolB-like protein
LTVLSVVALAVVVVGAAIVISMSGVFAPRASVQPAASADALASGGSAAIVVVPFDVLDADDRSRALAGALTEEVLLELDEHELFATAIEPVAPGAERAAPTAPNPNRYVLTGSVRDTPDGVRITARLVLASTGAQLWSASYDETPAIVELHAQQTAVARRIASVAAPYGPVFAAELVRTAALPPGELRTSDCVLKYYEYRSSQGPVLHDSALGCFEHAASTMPELANSWAGLALLLLDVYTFGYGRDAIARDAARERAAEAARTAMDTDGASLLANLALTRVLFMSGASFEGSAQRALSLCPNNIEALSLLGGVYVLAGDAELGLAMVDRAIELAPNPPGNYYAFKAVGQLRVHDYEGALASALRIDAPNWYVGHIVVTATAALAGRDDIAARSRARALELYPATEAELPDLLDRFRVAPDLRAELRRGFNAVGWSVP